MALTITRATCRLLAIVGLLIPAALRGQEAETIIRTETHLALLRFHAVHKNQYVDNLQPEDIQLLEDGKPQKLALFEGPRTAGGQRQTPLEVILLFDVIRVRLRGAVQALDHSDARSGEAEVRFRQCVPFQPCGQPYLSSHHEGRTRCFRSRR
jgi:hypothetical protein